MIGQNVTKTIVTMSQSDNFVSYYPMRGLVAIAHYGFGLFSVSLTSGLLNIEFA